MPIALDLCCLILSLQKPLELSTCTGVGGCGCPISSNAVRIGTASCVARKMAPTLDLIADIITVFIIFARAYIIPLSGGCLLSGYPGVVGFGPRKNKALALLRALVSDRYDASLAVHKTISLPRYSMYASGCAAQLSKNHVTLLIVVSVGLFCCVVMEPRLTIIVRSSVSA